MSETVEERTRRRRWINLAELVGVAGVLIAGAGLYFSWSDRQEARQERAAARTGPVFRVRAQADADGQALVLLRDGDRGIDRATVTFPRALGVGSKEALTDRIEREWFADALLDATDGGADDRVGTLPVLIAVRFSDGDRSRETSGIYDVVWRTHGRAGRGRALELTGLRLNQRGGDQAALDAAWAKVKP